MLSWVKIVYALSAVFWVVIWEEWALQGMFGEKLLEYLTRGGLNFALNTYAYWWGSPFVFWNKVNEWGVFSISREKPNFMFLLCFITYFYNLDSFWNNFIIFLLLPLKKHLYHSFFALVSTLCALSRIFFTRGGGIGLAENAA